MNGARATVLFHTITSEDLLASSLPRPSHEFISTGVMRCTKAGRVVAAILYRDGACASSLVGYERTDWTGRAHCLSSDRGPFLLPFFPYRSREHDQGALSPSMHGASS